LAAKLKTELRTEPELLAGSGGVFDVAVDGRLVFSKHDAGHFPNEDLLVETIRETM
jgi:selT/selW/selH-like putative selenoprotein